MTEIKAQTAQKKAEVERRLSAALKRNMLRRKEQIAQREARKETPDTVDTQEEQL